MNYISRRLLQKLDYLRANGDSSSLLVNYRAAIEFGLTLVLAYLWNQHFRKLKAQEREWVLHEIERPSIGTILSIARKLDRTAEVFSNKKINKLLEAYPSIRNERIGHGFTFQDGESQFADALEPICNTLFNTPAGCLGRPFDLVLVNDKINSNYRGTVYKPNGFTYLPWQCSEEVTAFESGSLYLHLPGGKYYRISPFIHMTNDDSFYVYCSLQEPLNGTVKYNRLIQTGTLRRDWTDFQDPVVEVDGLRRRCKNGTIINIFDNNYKRYNGEVDMEIELKGLLLTYSAIAVIAEKEELKQLRRFDEMEHSAYSRLVSDLRRRMMRIANEGGLTLITRLRQLDIAALSSGARQNIDTGIYQLINLFVRANRLDQAEAVSRFASDAFPEYLRQKYRNRLTSIRKLVDERNSR